MMDFRFISDIVGYARYFTIAQHQQGQLVAIPCECYGSGVVRWEGFYTEPGKHPKGFSYISYTTDSWDR